MEWKDWEPTYREIARDMNYSPDRERYSQQMGRRLSEMNEGALSGKAALMSIGEAIGEYCTVFGGSPGLAASLQKSMKRTEGTSLIASDGACATLWRENILPDIIVTDADGDLDAEREMNEMGALLLLHFHGDNADEAFRFGLSLRGRFIITTQFGPTEGTFNFGGFTDGDRAVLLCEHFHARRILLIGFDFSEAGNHSDVHSRKLRIAEEIVNGVRTRGTEFLQL